METITSFGHKLENQYNVYTESAILQCVKQDKLFEDDHILTFNLPKKWIRKLRIRFHPSIKYVGLNTDREEITRTNVLDREKGDFCFIEYNKKSSLFEEDFLPVLEFTQFTLSIKLHNNTLFDNTLDNIEIYYETFNSDNLLFTKPGEITYSSTTFTNKLRCIAGMCGRAFDVANDYFIENYHDQEKLQRIIEENSHKLQEYITLYGVSIENNDTQEAIYQ